jgi:hypothetical protein
MVNYDLPWNPNRLEQRFGRIHRIGQTEVCHLWNLLAEETREGDVYRKLLEKLEQARKALGGQVFDVLGKLQFEGRPLRELLIEAIRYGDLPEVRARLTKAVESALDLPFQVRQIGGQSFDLLGLQEGGSIKRLKMRRGGEVEQNAIIGQPDQGDDRNDKDRWRLA